MLEVEHQATYLGRRVRRRLAHGLASATEAPDPAHDQWFELAFYCERTTGFEPATLTLAR